jgi:large subunit ribosomal protein L5
MERSSLYIDYKKKLPSIMKDLKLKNVMQAPELKKIVINVGAGKAVADANYMKSAVEDISLITGQKPIINKAKVSESNFKLRKGVPIGLKVTLRKDRMYDFLSKLVNVALARTRDFEGLNPKSFDGRGNYTFGIKEHLIFYEIDFDKVVNVIGMDVTLVTSAKNDEQAEVLLRHLGLPLKEKKNG